MNIITQEQALEMYDDQLNDVYDMIEIGSFTAYPSDVLQEMDPTMYRIGFFEYIDTLLEQEIYVEGYTDDPDRDQVKKAVTNYFNNK